jgi:hypothetical protein
MQYAVKPAFLFLRLFAIEVKDSAVMSFVSLVVDLFVEREIFQINLRRDDSFAVVMSAVKRTAEQAVACWL